MRLSLKPILLLALLVLGVTQLVSSNPVAEAGAPGSVIINELMYNPGSGNQDDEYLELYNTTGSAIDLEGWCFSAGITLVTAHVDPACFPAGTSIAANGYLIVSPDSAQTSTTYGLTPSVEYIGTALSNGGETITLVDETAQVIDTITYDDATPWPLSPDGGGPSLELKDPNTDNTNGSNWGASVGGPTPMAENSWLSLNLPTITSVSDPNNITDADTVTITANVADATSVNLVYKVMFNADVTIPMLDDGNSGDGAAGDNLYGASIPAQSAGELVRFRVEADGLGGDSSSPSSDDSIDYHGYVVRGSSQEGTPVIEWFIEPSQYADLIDDPSGTDQTFFDCVIAYGDDVWDSSRIRLKGSYSRTFDKKPFKVNLPSGYTLNIPGEVEGPVSEFHLNSDYASGNRYINSLLGWRVFEHAGFPVPERTKIDLRRNGSVEGSYTLIEKYDKAWQSKYPRYRTGSIYENTWEKRQPDDGNFQPILDWYGQLEGLSGDDRRNYLMQTTDIPNLLNYMSVQAMIRNGDWSHYQNTLTYQDTSDTERWSFLPWDLDLNFQALYPFNQPYNGLNNMIDPTDTMDTIPAEDRLVFSIVWEDPVLKEMYQRRVRTLVDELYSSGLILEWLNEEYNLARTAAESDNLIRYNDEQDEQRLFFSTIFTNFGIDVNNPLQMQAVIDSGIIPDDFPMQDYFDAETIFNLPNPEQKIAILEYGLQKQAELYIGDYTQQGIIPNQQSSVADVKIEDVVNPTEESGYLKLKNYSQSAVDVSGWSIQGLGITLPGGSVIPASSSAYVAVRDTIFRQQHGGNNLVLLQTGQTFPVNGSLAFLRSNNSVAGYYSYGGIQNGQSDVPPVLRGGTQGGISNTSKRSGVAPSTDGSDLSSLEADVPSQKQKDYSDTKEDVASNNYLKEGRPGRALTYVLAVGLVSIVGYFIGSLVKKRLQINSA